MAQTEESASNAGDLSLIPGWGRSPGEGNGCPLQYSCLENSTDRAAWRAYSPKGCNYYVFTIYPLINITFYTEVYLKNLLHLAVVVQSLSLVWLFLTPWTGSSVLHYLPEFAQNPRTLSWWCYLTISSSVTYLAPKTDSATCICLDSKFLSGRCVHAQSWLTLCDPRDCSLPGSSA